MYWLLFLSFPSAFGGRKRKQDQKNMLGRVFWFRRFPFKRSFEAVFGILRLLFSMVFGARVVQISSYAAPFEAESVAMGTVGQWLCFEDSRSTLDFLPSSVAISGP